MKIIFKKLTAQEMVDKSIKKTLYVNPRMMVLFIMLVLVLIEFSFITENFTPIISLITQ